MTAPDQKQLFQQMVGTWEGTCRTWFKPGELADESEVRGRIEAVMGNFLRHTYEGSMQSKPRKGEELIAYEAITAAYQVSWIDDFHMSQSILFSDGPAIPNGFSVLGKYEVGKDHPAWGWRTNYTMSNDNLTISAYNIPPDGDEALAVETKYVRVDSE